MSPAKRLAAAAILAMLALHLAWRLWLVPPTQAAPWAVALYFSLPILPAVVLVLLRHPKAGFWGALAALLYFCHGVMLAWSEPSLRALGLVEAVLSAVLVVAASWDGLLGRMAARRRARPRV